MRRVTLAGASVLCACSFFALGGMAGVVGAGAPAAVAPSAAPAAVTTAVDTITTLPLFGAQLVVDVASGPGGAMTSVTLTPAGTFTATKLDPNQVRFVSADGMTKVNVSSHDGNQKVQAKAGQLSDISGPGIWSGDVFGTGTATTVNFTVGALADGSPDITGITSSDATAQIGAVDHSSDNDGQEQEAVARIVFTSGIQQRTLTIKVSVDTQDGESQAKLSVSLSKMQGQALPAVQVIGAHVWNGLLCDGSAAQINYTVNANGSVTVDSTTPDAAKVQNNDKGVNVTFSHTERVMIRVKSDDNAQPPTMKVTVSEKIHCDSPVPTVNTPIATSATDGSGDHHHSGDHKGGDSGGDSSASQDSFTAHG